MLAQMQNYQSLNPSDVRVLVRRAENGLDQSLLIFQTPFGYRRVAQFVRPEGQTACAAILFAHWYESESITSHRSQFEAEAEELSRRGAACMTVETLWSDRDFFLKRTQADDMRNSIEEVVNLRRFMDYLLIQPGVDARRLAVVGHDFGGMYGVLAGSLDRRPTHYVIMAATPRFPDWYLYLPKLEGQEREAFLREMAPIDPIARISNLAPAPILFQFADNDPHVPKERAEEFFAAAREPKELKWYQAGHGLNEESMRDRKAWLVERLGLKL